MKFLNQKKESCVFSVCNSKENLAGSKLARIRAFASQKEKWWFLEVDFFHFSLLHFCDVRSTFAMHLFSTIFMLFVHNFRLYVPYVLNWTEISCLLNNFGADWLQFEQKSDKTFNAPNLFDEMSNQKILCGKMVLLHFFFNVRKKSDKSVS